MSASHRLLTVLACAAGATALSAPAAVAAQTVPSNGQGVVLSLGGHAVRLVDKAHRVNDVRVSSTRGLRRGDVVRVRQGRARVSSHARRVSFLGRVVRSSGKRAVVRLGDGSTFKVGAGKPHGHRARSASNVTIDLQGLTPGQTVLVTIATDGQGNVAITIRVLPAATEIGGDGHGDGSDDPGPGDDGDGADDDCADEVDGTVTALAGDGSSVTIAPDDGTAAATYATDDPSLLDGITVGDDVAVTLDEDGTAIDVELLDDGSDDPGPGDDDGGDE